MVHSRSLPRIRETICMCFFYSLLFMVLLISHFQPPYHQDHQSGHYLPDPIRCSPCWPESPKMSLDTGEEPPRQQGYPLLSQPLHQARHSDIDVDSCSSSGGGTTPPSSIPSSTRTSSSWKGLHVQVHFPLNISIFNLSNAKSSWNQSLSQLDLSLNSCIHCISAPTFCPASSVNKFGSTVNSSDNGNQASSKSLCIFTLDGASHRSRLLMSW